MSWDKVKIGDCCEITSSKRIFFSEYVESGVPFYRSKEIIESSNGQAISEPLFISQEKYNEIKRSFGVPQPGDMLLTSVGTIGIPYIVKEDDYFYFKDGNLTWFRKFNGTLISQYLFYWIRSTEGYSALNNTTIGSSQKALTIASLKGLKIPCPPIEIQNRIVRILSAYDNLIETNQKQIKLLEEAAQRLYKEWFVDLHFPGYENTPITDGVPQGWGKRPIGDVIEKSYRSKQVMASDYLKEGNIPIIDQSRDFIAGYTNDEETLVCLNIPVIVFGDHTRVLKYIQFPFAKGADGTQLILSDCESLPQSLLYLSLLNVDLSNYHYARHFKYLKAEEIIIPNVEIATKFDFLVTPIFKKVQILRDQIINAQQARDRLLPKLMSGEIEV